MRSPLALALCAGLAAACGGTTPPTPAAPTGATATLALLESTDLHQNIRSYDYYKLAEDQSVGLERLATLITAARAQFPDSLLIDNGDTIQGTVLGDYQATVSPVACSGTLAIYKVMNALKYDVGGVGNHEFNFGLSYLNQVTGSQFTVDGLSGPSVTGTCSGPAFPLVLSNVISVKTGKPLFNPYVILSKQVTATDPAGKTVTSTVKVGVLAFAPPYITTWDKANLQGKVTTTGLKEAATQYVAELKAKGSDVIVAISHGAIDFDPPAVAGGAPTARAYDPGMENGNYWLAQVPGIDALLMGHAHLPFPLASSTQPQFNVANVDKAKGFVFAVPAVMANFWGKALGVIQLNLVYDGSKWVVDTTKTQVELRSTQNADKSFVAADATIAPLVETEHQATISYVKTPLGATDFEMNTYFADVGDVTALQLVNQAQADYVAAYIRSSLPALASLPLLSVTAPFKSGAGGGSDYTDVLAGNVAINNAADLYLYANTLYAVKITGADLKAWLEASAGRFNQIDPAKTAAQALVSTTFPGYNFDVVTSADLSYEIDVTQTAGSRIKNLAYKGAAVDPAASFVIATNNYRGNGGGPFPFLAGGLKVVLAAPDANRDVLMRYIKTVGAVTRAANGSARSWRFTKVTTAGPVTFTSAVGKLALATAAGLANVSGGATDDGSGKGTALYTLDLSK